MDLQQILALDVVRAIEEVTLRKRADMQQFLYLVDTYGLTEIAKWLHNTERNLSMPSPGLISDVRR